MGQLKLAKLLFLIALLCPASAIAEVGHISAYVSVLEYTYGVAVYSPERNHIVIIDNGE